jgi:hypothetical protein
MAPNIIALEVRVIEIGFDRKSSNDEAGVSIASGAPTGGSIRIVR